MEEIRKKLQNLAKSSEINNDFLYDYIISHGIKYTSNKNGIFVNLTGLDDNQIKDMYNYIEIMTINLKKTQINIIPSKNIEQHIEKVYEELPVFDELETKILELSKTI